MKIEELLGHLLPKELFTYFDLVSLEEVNTEDLHLHLDEKKVVPPELKDKQLISYGFDEPVKIQDFPLRHKRVYLIVRRRKWQDKKTRKIYSRKWNLTAKGSSYSKEFAAFLKELFG